IEKSEVIIYSSSIEIGLQPRPNGLEPWDGEPLPPKAREPFLSINDVQEWKESANGVFTGTSIDPKSGNEFMVCLTEPSEGMLIYLTQPVDPINRSVNQSNILLIACTILFLGITALHAFRISRGFTKPIRQIKEQVGRIAELDFTGKTDISTGDELESLSKDINKLADQLRDALDKLREQNARLEKDILSQKRFISNASHELRAPLALIKGYADEINTGFFGNSTLQARYLGIISDESTKMKRLINELLDLSRLESGSIGLVREEMCVEESIQAFLDKYNGFIEDNALDVEFDPKEMNTGSFDPMRFEQVMANYISNTSKYGDNRKKVVISTRNEGNSIRISVYNSGKPVAEDTLENMWGGFYKAEAARTRSEGSYGLGLSIVKAIQEAAGMGFGAYNEDDGIVFWFEVESAGKSAGEEG
ncbi:MAG: HAMP domain-containing histidine kinase, partial [Clostridia bacterium]|nr:HAMP domain-containing histidine kinase [Clostridia bacterium]